MKSWHTPAPPCEQVVDARFDSGRAAHVAQLARDPLRRGQDAVEAGVVAVPLVPQSSRVRAERDSRARQDELETRVARKRLLIPVREPAAARLAVLDNGVDGELEELVRRRDVDAMHEIAVVIDAATRHRPRMCSPARTPACAATRGRERACAPRYTRGVTVVDVSEHGAMRHRVGQRVSTHVSLLPPPWDELTTSSSGSPATRVSPPGTIHGRSSSSTNGRRSTARGSNPPPARRHTARLSATSSCASHCRGFALTPSRNSLARSIPSASRNECRSHRWRRRA